MDVTSWVCAAGGEDHRGGIPIGRPIANTRIHLLDRDLQPVPVGVPGELFIAGVNLARGYVERPDLTAERFLPDAEGTEPGGRVYRTGDLARRRGDGAIEFLGRLDHQVKIRGVRIELGEIEAALLALPGVREAVVVARESREGGESRGEKRLVAYVVGDAPVETLRQALRERLPEAMVPAAFVPLPALPLTANGKVDRKALPAPGQPGAREISAASAASETSAAAEASAAPRTREEEILAAVWAQILRLPQVSVNDNFFELGGDSILSVQIVARARQAGLRLTTRQVFDHPTVAELARHATATNAADAANTGRAAGLTPAEQGAVEGEVPLTPIQRWFFDADLRRSSPFQPGPPVGAGRTPLPRRPHARHGRDRRAPRCPAAAVRSGFSGGGRRLAAGERADIADIADRADHPLPPGGPLGPAGGAPARRP